MNATIEAIPGLTTKPDRAARTERQPPYHVILLDDDDHTYDYVIEMFRKLFGHTFEHAYQLACDVDLSGRPKMYSLRGYTRAKDGQIHTDSKDKIITVLLYLNDNWQQPGGRLRILKNSHDVDDYAAEVPPDNGTLLVFKRSDSSWHGHHPFEGPRRSLQMNWMTSEGSKGWHKVRHTISAAVKKLTAAE